MHCKIMFIEIIYRCTYTYQFLNLSWIIKCLFWRNMELLSALKDNVYCHNL